MTRSLLLAAVWAAAWGGAAQAQVLNPLPAKVFGQPDKPRSLQQLVNPIAVAPNMAKANSLNGPNSVALDTSVSPPILYIADTGNHRVLAWRDAMEVSMARPADRVIGQPNFHSTAPGVSATALFTPSSVAVDAMGNLFVMDAGNNRILRFPKPFEQPEGEAVRADLVIGQPNLQSNLPNRSSSGTAAPTASTIRTNGPNTGGIQNASIVFDAEGNLWFSDSGNHRILRYPADEVRGPSNTSSSGRTISANLVLGQPDFVSAVANQGRITSNPPDRLLRDRIRFGGPLAVDSAGNLFFADDLARVLVWQPPFFNNKPASRILGIYVVRQGETPPPDANSYTFGFTLGQSGSNVIFTGGPQGLWCEQDSLFVADTYSHRVVRYDPVSSWPPENPLQGQISPQMSAVFGQENFNQNQPNRRQYAEPTAESFSLPVGGASAFGRMFIVDKGNNRVLSHPYDPGSGVVMMADAAFGQLEFAFRAPNLIEGRELQQVYLWNLQRGTQVFPVGVGPAMAIHYPENPDEPPHLYVADPGNHRVLAYWDARQFEFGKVADFVIGQVGHTRALVNSPHNNPSQPTRTGLRLPSSVAVDAEGNLWVADAGNGRLLRFPRPFDRWEHHQEADLVLGQPDFETAPDGEPRRERMALPVSVAVTNDGKVIAADAAHHRVLVFRGPFENGQPAMLVLGQPDDRSAAPGSDPARLSLPLSVAVDSEQRIYVADTNNDRLLVFGRAEFPADGAEPVLVLNLAASNRNVTPAGVTVNRANGEIWIADARGNRVLRYPGYVDLVFAQAPVAPVWNYGFTTYRPRSLLLNERGALMVGDAANRITMHYPLHGVLNGASGFPRIAPNTIVTLEAPDVSFSGSLEQADGSPLPKDLADVEVLVEGMPAPLMSVNGSVIRMVVPKDAPISGLAEFLVRKRSTGEILAHNYVTMSNASPAVLFAGTNPATQGQARAANQDGSPNSSSNPAQVGQELTVSLTGTGRIDGMPEDGEAPASEVPVSDVQAFVITPSGAISAPVLSSTLDPAEPGVWRVRVRVPQVALDGNYGFAVIYRSMASNRMPDGSRTSLPTIAIRR